MDLLGQYHGNYTTAQSASEYIDVNAIVAGCQSLSDAGYDFYNVGDKLYDAGDNCGADALSFDGKALNSEIYDGADEVSKYPKQITELAQQIIDNTVAAYNEIQKTLNDNAYQIECEYARQQNQ